MKSVLTLITKLSDRTINGELLRYLAKTANDEQPGIRTNTTICLGKIAKYLGSSSRSKVLIAAFSRSLRDPFVHARNASLLALSVTSDYFTDEDCALRLVPAICPSLIDKEKLIRDQASKTIDVYLAKIKKAAASMPDSVLPPEGAASAAGGPRMSTPQPAESSAAASWAGWAISSFTNKLSTAAGEIQPSSTPVNGSATPAPAKRPTTASQPASTSSASNLHRQALKSPPPSAPLTSGGGSKDSFFPEDDDNEEDAADAWGDMDDMAEDDDNNTNDAGDAAAGFFTANDNNTTHKASTATTTTLPRKSTPTTTPTTATTTPFDDASEPDFAGWLAAQAEKKKGGGAGGKGLPKGLSKAGGGSSAGKKTVAAAARPKAAAAGAVKKKIDLKPKQSEEDDGWGGW